MGNLKLFPKTYIFTMILMSMIIIVSHTLLYMLLPTLYNNKKQKELANISEGLVKQLKGENSEGAIDIVNNFAKKYKLNIILTIGGKTTTYEGINQADVYIDTEEFKYKDLILPDIGDNIIDNDLNSLFNNNNLNNPTNLIGDNSNYFKMKGPSIFRNDEFKSLNDIEGEIKIMMSLQSLKEARSVVFMILPYSIGISLVISIIASYLYTKIITDPIRRICDTTKGMEALDKEAYCVVNTGDEMEILAENINSLYSTLWNTIDNLESEIKNVSESEKFKVDFLRSASHELKTPLMSIHIMLENMILNVGKYKNHDIYLNKCKDEVDKLSKMVQDILNTSRLNTFDKHMKSADTSIGELLEEAIAPYKVTAKYKYININVNYPKELSIRTNKELLSKALSNIISNAVNYTDSGGNINIYFNKNSLTIENECIPIPKEHLDKVFEAFYRAEFDRNRNTGGNGLGLYIVKQILNTLDIKHSFDATERGMKFTIIFKKYD
ncbi:HAMP domain-containing sensor histidine kinase [Clostridium sp. LP20]|uniref:HAMP domain-containing sensor histidine kinase n=1 Tax=Clostridium sp. LP20 TaxID=3418665 RepID=UPI003EE55ED7